jgi:hypothetical protein
VKKIILLSALLCLFLAGSAPAEKEKAKKPKYTTNTVYLDKVTAAPGEHFGVKVYLFSTDTLAGMQVPIFFRSETIDLYCDSVSFEGSRCQYMMFEDVKIPEDEEGKQTKVVYFSFINTIDPEKYIDPLPPGEGLVATIYFTVPKDAPEGVVPLTRGMIPHPHISFIFSVWDHYGEEADGTFEENEIIIKKKK